VQHKNYGVLLHIDFQHYVIIHAAWYTTKPIYDKA